MNNKGCLPTVIGSLIIVAIIIWLFKILVILGIIGSIITAVYFGYFAYKQPNNRKRLLKRRVLPALIVTIICGGIIGISSNSHTSSLSNSASSSSKASSDDSRENSSSSDDVTDESSNSDYDDNSDDNDSDSYSDNNDSNNSESDVDTNRNGNSVNNQGDMTIDSKGLIVGNSKTLIYHTPDQHGYRMNSANAVYFNSESEAQAAGYRKALR